MRVIFEMVLEVISKISSIRFYSINSNLTLGISHIFSCIFNFSVIPMTN